MTDDENTKGRRPSGEDQPAAQLRAALQDLHDKAGTDGDPEWIAEWLSEVEEIVAGVRSKDLDVTREELGELISGLLELNAEVQNLTRLKQLLS
jgi:hypothetical protein